MSKTLAAIRAGIYALGGRRFVLTVLGATLVPYLESRGVSENLIYCLCSLIMAFVVGESFRDGLDSVHKDTIIDGNLQVSSNRNRYEASTDAKAAQAIQKSQAAQPGPESTTSALGFRANRTQRGEQ